MSLLVGFRHFLCHQNNKKILLDADLNLSLLEDTQSMSQVIEQEESTSGKV